MASPHRHTRVTIGLLAALVLAAALIAACAAKASDGQPGGTGTAKASAGSATAAGDATTGATAAATAATGAKTASAGRDWTRTLEALAYLRATQTSDPVVVLLGGSAARESTVSDKDWRKQIVAKGGPQTSAWNMGSRNRTMAQNLAIVKKLPPGVHALVYVGINLGAFTSPQKSASITLPSPAPTKVELQQPHQYMQSNILSTAKKRTLVQQWMPRWYGPFTADYRINATLLEDIVKLCQSRGYYPVLFELPRDRDVIRTALNTPTTRYRKTCRALAAKYDIPWVSLISAAAIPDSHFYDLWHLVQPGRATWQELLSAKSAELLNSDAFTNAGP